MIINIVEIKVLTKILQLSKDPKLIVQQLVREQTEHLFEDFDNRDELENLIPLLSQD